MDRRHPPLRVGTYEPQPGVQAVVFLVLKRNKKGTQYPESYRPFFYGKDQKQIKVKDMMNLITFSVKFRKNWAEDLNKDGRTFRDGRAKNGKFLRQNYMEKVYQEFRIE